jgi:carbon monoxide dehydrogenase subunit G
MKITTTFAVAAPIEEAWNVLIDIERIAPCVPGFQLKEIEGEKYRGSMKIKVGSVVAEYAGQMEFISRDPANYEVVVSAAGSETRGQGGVGATVTGTLTEADGATMVEIVADVLITGRVAGFGRGILTDVTKRLADQFARRLERDILSPAVSPDGNR